MSLSRSSTQKKALASLALGSVTALFALGTTAHAATTATAAPGFDISVFATPPAGLSKPDSLAVVNGNVWIAYGNQGKPDGSGGAVSQIVEYKPDGAVIKTLKIAGHNDGLRLDPVSGEVWAIQNEDGNANLVVINPTTGNEQKYAFGPGKHGGGYDDVTFRAGKAFVSASAPNVDGGAKNAGPAIVSADLGKNGKIAVSAVLQGTPSVVNRVTGATETLNLTDPDSITQSPAGSLVMTSQDDGELLFVKDPGTSAMQAQVLHLAGGVKVDDTTFVTAKHGYILVADTSANVVYKIQSAAWDVGSAFSAMSGVHASGTRPAVAGYVGMLDLATGTLAPITSKMTAPHGLIFVPQS